jgi:hypothetical protein
MRDELAMVPCYSSDLFREQLRMVVEEQVAGWMQHHISESFKIAGIHRQCRVALPIGKMDSQGSKGDILMSFHACIIA